jgi:glucose dehydrogenase
VQERFLWRRRHSLHPLGRRRGRRTSRCGSDCLADEPANSTAASDDNNGLSAGKSLEWNRYTNLKEIDRANVAQLKPSWTFKIDDDREQEAAPIVWNGTIFISTPHDHVIALDAKDGGKKWEFSYDPAHVISFATNRGVALVEIVRSHLGLAFISTSRVIDNSCRFQPPMRLG